MRFKQVLVLALSILVSLSSIPSSTLHAQGQTPNQSVVLSLAVSGQLKTAIQTNNVLQGFEAANPGVTVQLVDAPSIPLAANGVQAHFDALTSYANSADVLYVTSSAVSPAATRAGYFLDLSSLITSDSTLNAPDFYPALWQSYQWDGGTWALPIDGTLLVLGYDPAAFDKAGLNYPTDQWTVNDLVNAVNKLTQKDPNGNVTVPGMALAAPIVAQMLLRSLIGVTLVDSSMTPNTPLLDQGNAETVMTAIAQQLQMHQIGTNGSDLLTAPLVILPANGLLTLAPARKTALMPGGKAGLEVDGFAISKGTQSPEQAFALLKYLTTRPELAVGSTIPARKNLLSAANFPTNVGSQLDSWMQNALPLADVRFTDYLIPAVTQMAAQNTQAATALQTAQAQALTDLQTAEAQKSKLALQVVPPAALAPLSPGKVAITFNVNSVTLPLPNQSIWNKVIADFVASDPEVGRVTLTTNRQDINRSVAQYDCFYQPSNVINNTDLSQLLSVDSLLDADKTFDRGDVVGTVLADLQTDNKTWAIPIDISPIVLRYNSTILTKLSVTPPANGWTITDFVNALKTLKADTGTSAPLVAGVDGTYMLFLVAAFGGLPIDYRTNPPTINFTDPKTEAAIQQALDLARNGYIQYSPLATLFQGSGISPGNPTSPLYPDLLNVFAAQQAQPSPSGGGPTYQVTTFPSGDYVPVGYTIGTAYISAKATSPEGCYRFISVLSQHPELFSGMPARSSQLNAPALKAVLDPQTLAFYNHFAAMLKDSRAVPILPSANALATLPRFWLYQAFDQYVTQGTDLKAALQNAETITKGYVSCTANLPPFQVGSGIASIGPYAKCAVKVDPTMANTPLGALAK